MPSDVTSKTAYLHPAFAAFLKNFCTANLTGMVIFSVFFHSSFFTPKSGLVNILKRREETEATGSPASSKIADKRCTNVVLPFVPVTPITFIFCEGKQ